MRTPKEVKEAAKAFIEEDGAKLTHIGEYNGREVFNVVFPDGMCTGYPIIFLYKEGEPVMEVQYEMDVFKIMLIAAKNIRENRKKARQSK